MYWWCNYDISWCNSALEGNTKHPANRVIMAGKPPTMEIFPAGHAYSNSQKNNRIGEFGQRFGDFQFNLWDYPATCKHVKNSREINEASWMNHEVWLVMVVMGFYIVPSPMLQYFFASFHKINLGRRYPHIFCLRMALKGYRRWQAPGCREVRRSLCGSLSTNRWLEGTQT